jgi:hypothetical protein
LSGNSCSKEFTQAINASDVGVGAVLLQQGRDNIDLPICFSSKKLDKQSEKLFHN